MSNDLISIIIPCYRQAHLLPKAIKSCIQQTHRNVEIIIVDDGSPDDVEAAIEPYRSEVKLIQQENKGLSLARNAGLVEAKGCYIKFLDSDDWLLPHCIEHQYLALKNLPMHISVIGYSLFFNDNSRPNENIYPDFGKLSHSLCYINTGPPHTYLFPINAIQKIGGFDSSNRVNGGHEDYDLLCRLALLGYEVIANHTIGCIYRKSPGSMSMNIEGMRHSRKHVWQHYATGLLTDTCDDDLLTHLLEGYALRVSTGDIKYEFLDILDEIVSQLQTQQNNISQVNAFSISNGTISLRKQLPSSVIKNEQVERIIFNKLLDDLTSVCLQAFPDTPFQKQKYLYTLAALFNSYLWVNRGSVFRSKIKKLRETKVRRSFLDFIYTMIKIINRIIPNIFKKND